MIKRPILPIRVTQPGYTIIWLCSVDLIIDTHENVRLHLVITFDTCADCAEMLEVVCGEVQCWKI